MAVQEKKVLIPRDTFQDLLDLLDWIIETDIQLCNLAMEDRLLTSLYVLREKEEKAQLRKAYANVIFARNENARHDARMKYLSQKRSIHGNPYAE